MTLQLKNQMTEIHNVLLTLTETTDHLATLAKADEFEQSIYLFTSLMEGIEAVFKVLPNFTIDVVKPMQEIEQALPTIAKAFEHDALSEVHTLVETSLQPALVTMSQTYNDALDELT